MFNPLEFLPSPSYLLCLSFQPIVSLVSTVISVWLLLCYLLNRALFVHLCSEYLNAWLCLVSCLFIVLYEVLLFLVLWEWKILCLWSSCVCLRSENWVMSPCTCSTRSIWTMEGGTRARGRESASSSFMLRVMVFRKCSNASCLTEGSFPWWQKKYSRFRS